MAINLGWRFGERLIHQPADDLPIIENEWHLVRTHFQNRPGPFAMARLMAKARIKKSGVPIAWQKLHGRLIATGVNLTVLPIDI